MKTNLKKKLAPYTIKDFVEAEGKLQIEAALKDKGMEPDEILGNNARVLDPDEDAMDLYKGKFLDEHMEGGH